MRIITLNLNGIRSAGQKGFFAWLDRQQADVVCLQETKAQKHQLTDPIFEPAGYHCFYHDAGKKGYSGVAIYCKEKPLTMTTAIGHAMADSEGRYIEIELPKIRVASLYLPSGSSGAERQQFKYEVLEYCTAFLKKIKRKKKEFILCGDLNIAHKPIDLKNWRGNQKNSGFLPEERAWLDMVFDNLGFIDGFREVNQEPDQYTWWSNRGQAWTKNVGWRIDYHVLSPGLKTCVKQASIYKDQRFSDHAPLILEYDL